MTPLLNTAVACARLGWYIFPLGEKSKVTDATLAPHSHKSASNDEKQIIEWWTKSPNANIGIDLGRSNITVLDFDKGEPPAELNLNGALRVKTGRGTHVYFAGKSDQFKMYFNGQHIGEVKSDGGYVLAPNSVHPDGPVYTVVAGEIEPVPEGLLDRLRGERKAPPTMQGDRIPRGSHDDELTRIAGRLRHDGLEEEAIYNAIVEVCEKRCDNYGTDYKEMCRKIAGSVCRYEVGKNTELALNQKPTAPEPVEIPEAPKQYAYPTFPSWVMNGTSVYEGLVKPTCDINPSRIPYFMWVPAMVVLSNYVGPKIKIKGGFGERLFKGGLYTVIIGRKGKTMKSSSANDAMGYLSNIGVLAHHGRDVKSAEGRVLVFTPGSMESLGINMQKTTCKSALLYYDELEMLANKANIDGSSMKSQLLNVYEGNKFENGVKSSRETFSLDPGTYCVSLISNTTVRKFPEWWSRLTDDDAGFDDRFTFILQPEKLPEFSVQEYVNTIAGSIVTKRLLDKAVMQTSFAFESSQHPLLLELGKIENRYAVRAEKWATILAIDLGRDTIDDDCIERAYALVQYEIAVKKHFSVQAARTREAQIQNEIRRTLEKQPDLRMPTRDLERVCKAHQYGTSLWGQAYTGLIRAGIIRLEGTGKKGDPFVTQALQILPRKEEDDDE
jgi:hypothetical protein